MTIVGVVSLVLHVLVLCAHGDSPSPGFSLPPCNVTLQTLDLGSFLHWQCPPMPPNTTFTVKTNTQGNSKWKKVTQCTAVTSCSCDLSQAFNDFTLYNFVLLHRATPGEHPAWTWMGKVDLMVFSAPSLALSLNGSWLSVQLRFPTSLSKSLCPGRKTCSVAMVMRVTTDITVYELSQPCGQQPLVFSGATANSSSSSTCDHLLRSPPWKTESQRVTVEPVSFEFGSLKEGWSYCAVANFTGSATAAPGCISLPPRVTALKPLLLSACGILIPAAILILFLFRRYCPSTESPLPRSLGSLQDFSFQELAMSPEDCTGDHLSVLSQSVSDSSPALPAAADALRDDFCIPCGYYDNPLCPDSMGEEDREDWEASGVALPDHEVAGPCGSPMGSLAPCDGMQQLPLGSGGPWDIPLCSVKLAPPEAEALQDWIHFSGPTGLKEAASLVKRTEPGQTEPAVDSCFSDD